MLYADYNFLQYKDIFYTVDMLRLRTDFSVEEFSKITFYINTIFKDRIKKYYVSHSFSSFRYNYVIELKEGSTFWFGFLHNSENNRNVQSDSKFVKHNFTIEFNPNKVDFGHIKYILDSTQKWIIKSVDFAMDIPLNIMDLYCFDKSKKRDIRVFSKGYDNKTIYMGKTNNRIKIYNKKIESNLDKDLTRVEITSQMDLNIRYINAYSYDFKLPDIYINEYIYTFSDYEKKNDTLMCILYALQYGYDFNDLSRKYKDKIKKLLNGGYKIDFSNEYCTDVLKKLIHSIFVFLN